MAFMAFLKRFTGIIDTFILVASEAGIVKGRG